MYPIVVVANMLIIVPILLLFPIASSLSIAAADAVKSQQTNHSTTTATMTKNNSSNEHTFRITQQAVANLNQTVGHVTPQNYVITLELSGKYTFNNTTMSADKNSFSGSLFGIENPVAGHAPQIQVKLDKVKNFTVSNDFKTVTYVAAFIDKTSKNLTASVLGTLSFQSPITLNKATVLTAIPAKSTMNITLGSIPLKEVQNAASGLKINEIALS